MRAEELMINNWVLDGDRYYQVDQHDFSYCETFKPIHLTEEWLVRFGFKYSDYYNNYRIIAGDYHNSIQLIDGEWLYNGDISDASRYSIRGIKYVHTLQNLFYALNDEELTLNETI